GRPPLSRKADRDCSAGPGSVMRVGKKVLGIRQGENHGQTPINRVGSARGLSRPAPLPALIRPSVDFSETRPAGQTTLALRSPHPRPAAPSSCYPIYLSVERFGLAPGSGAKSIPIWRFYRL